MSLSICRRVSVAWDRGHFPYVVTARWDEHGLLIVVQTRDQRTRRIHELSPDTGSVSELVTEVAPERLEQVAMEAGHEEFLPRLGTHSSLTVPLRAGGRTLGVLVYRHLDHHFKQFGA